MLSFLSLIIVGSLLLKLPISSATGKAIPYLDALFTATTATCVTGLVTLPIADTFSTFGHIVILGLIQVGGLAEKEGRTLALPITVASWASLVKAGASDGKSLLENCPGCLSLR